MGAPKDNQYALGNSGGRPRQYQAAQDLEKEVISYFQHCIDNKENVKVTSLALYLGFESRQSLFDYKSNKEFSYVIKRALLVIEAHYEDTLNTFRSMGGQFALKNMGWKDQQDQHITQTITTVSPQVVSVDTPLANSEQTIKE